MGKIQRQQKQNKRDNEAVYIKCLTYAEIIIFISCKHTLVLSFIKCSTILHSQLKIDNYFLQKSNYICQECYSLLTIILNKCRAYAHTTSRKKYLYTCIYILRNTLTLGTLTKTPTCTCVDRKLQQLNPLRIVYEQSRICHIRIYTVDSCSLKYPFNKTLSLNSSINHSPGIWRFFSASHPRTRLIVPQLQWGIQYTDSSV